MVMPVCGKTCRPSTRGQEHASARLPRRRLLPAAGNPGTRPQLRGRSVGGGRRAAVRAAFCHSGTACNGPLWMHIHAAQTSMAGASTSYEARAANAAGEYHQSRQHARSAATSAVRPTARRPPEHRQNLNGIASGLINARAFVTMACVRCPKGFTIVAVKSAAPSRRSAVRYRGGGTPDDRARKPHGAAPPAGR